MVENSKNSQQGDKATSLRFSEIWKIIQYRQWLVILIVSLSVLGTFVGHFIYTPTFTAVSTIGVSTEKHKTMADVLGANTPWAESNISERIHNYTQYLKSNDFMLEMAQSLKFKEYSSPLIFEAPQNLSILKPDFWIWVAQHLIGRPIKKNVEKHNPMKMSIEKVAGFLNSVVKVKTNHTSQISIEVITLDSYTSMIIANAFAKSFTEKTNSHDARGLLEVKKLLEEKLTKTKGDLKKAELELIEFKKQNRVSMTETQSSIYSDRINGIEKQIESTKIRLDENKRLLSYYTKLQKKRVQDVLDKPGVNKGSNQTQIALFNQKLDDLKKQKSLMLSQNYEEDHWRVKEVSGKINLVARSLKILLERNNIDEHSSQESSTSIQKKIEELKEGSRILEAKLGPLEKTKKELFTYLSQVPQAEQYQLMLSRKVELEYENFSLLRKKMNDIEIQLVSLDKKVIIDRLSSAPGPSKRRSLPAKLIFSALVGLFFGCMIAILLENLDTSIRHKSDLEDLGIHFLGEIPETEFVGDKKAKNNVKSPTQLVTLNQPDSLDSVVFDFVRSRLESDRVRNGRSSTSLCFTSVRPSEGKSFISANLAVSLSQLGKRVLLIDADLRCPSIHSYFNITNDQGLTDLFESNVGLDEVIHREVVPNLDVFSAGWGCKNPTVLVSSEKFRILMKFLRNEYDYVIVDTPPIGAVADASIISNMTDGIAIVARYRQTNKFDIQDAQFKIHQMASKRIFGIINFASNKENIVTYYPYVVPRGHTRDFSVNATTQRDDIQRFEDQLKRKKSG